MRFVTINNLKTRFFVTGSGYHDLLFIHGWAASGRMWLRPMWALRRQYRVWSLDLPGFGDSDAPGIDWCTAEQYADHVAEFCYAMNIKPYAVVGHSLGSRVALDMARRYPELVERLIITSPLLTGRLGFNLNLMIGGLGQVISRASRTLWPLATAGVLSTYWAPNFLSAEGAKRQADDMRRSSWEAAVGSLQAVVNQDYSKHLPQIQQPALVVAGRKDYTIPPRDAEITADLLPNGQLVMLEHVHHWPTDEDLPAVVYLIKAFLDKAPFEAVI